MDGAAELLYVVMYAVCKSSYIALHAAGCSCVVLWHAFQSSTIASTVAFRFSTASSLADCVYGPPIQPGSTASRSTSTRRNVISRTRLLNLPISKSHRALTPIRLHHVRRRRTNNLCAGQGVSLRWGLHTRTHALSLSCLLSSWSPSRTHRHIRFVLEPVTHADNAYTFAFFWEPVPVLFSAVLNVLSLLNRRAHRLGWLGDFAGLIKTSCRVPISLLVRTTGVTPR